MQPRIKVLPRIILSGVISFEVGQPVAVYWGENEDGNYEFYAGTVSVVVSKGIVVTMNFGDDEVVSTKDLSGVILLEKPYKGKEALTKSQVGKIRAKTGGKTASNEEPPLFKPVKKSEDNVNQVNQIKKFVDQILRKKLVVPDNHEYQLELTSSPAFLRDFSAWLRPVDKENGYTVEIRFKTGEYDAILFAKRGEYLDSTIDLVEPFRDKMRFIKGNSWKELADNAVTATNYVLEKAPETVEKALKMRKEAKEMKDRADTKRKAEEQSEKLPNLVRKNGRWVVLNEFNNEMSDYEGLATMPGSSLGKAIAYFYKDTRYITFFKEGDDVKKLIKHDIEQRDKERRYFELFQKSEDPTSIDWKIKQQGDTSIFIEREDQKDFTGNDIKQLEDWLNPFGFKISRDGNIWYEGFGLVDSLAKPFILELVNKANHEAQQNQKSIDKARSAKEDAYLDEPLDKSGFGTTRREMIDSFIRKGAVLKNEPQHSKAESDKLMKEYQMVSKNAPIGNINHPQTQRLMELRKQLNDPSNPVKGYGFWVVKDNWFLDWNGKSSSPLTPVMLKYAREQLDKKELGLQ